MAVDDPTCMACKPALFQVREIKQALIQFLTLHAIVIKKWPLHASEVEFGPTRLRLKNLCTMDVLVNDVN